MSKTKILNKKSLDFLEKYLNNAAPTGYESEGQKIWMDYLTPYVDEFITDTYGTAVGVINPEAPFKVVIEGHADERGSREYNVGLGERRAQTVRRMLLLNGVAPDQISTVSYGEEQPIEFGSNESSYTKNRRVELVIN